MGFRFQRRIRIGRGTYVNASGSGLSMSQRTSWGSIGTRGVSVRTGIPGLTWRTSWGRSGGAGGVAMLIVGGVVVMFYATIAMLWLSYWMLLVGFEVARWLVLTCIDLYRYFAHNEQPKPELDQSAQPPALALVHDFQDEDGLTQEFVEAETGLAAVDVAAIEAKRYWIAAATFRKCVTGVTMQTRNYSRALYDVERRVPTIRMAAAGATGMLQPPPQAQGFDVWRRDPSVVPGETRVVCRCANCSGSGEIACGSCDGTTRARCMECGGGGRVAGQRGSKQCPRCRASGNVKCKACKSGRVQCRTCTGSGCVYAWIEVVVTQRPHVVVDGGTPGGLGHAGLATAEDFNRGEQRGRMILDSGSLPRLTTPRPELACTLEVPFERARSVRVQDFACKVFKVHFETLYGPGHVRLVDVPPLPATGSNTTSLLMRPLVAGGVVLAGVATTTLAVGAHVAQHPWYEQFGGGSAMLTCGLLATLAGGGMSLQVTLPPRARSVRTLIGVAAALLVGVSGAFAVPSIYQPSLTSAKAALANKAFDAVVLEADAVGLDPAQKVEANNLVDQAHSERLTAAADVASKLVVLQEPWRSEEILIRAAETVGTNAVAGMAANGRDPVWLVGTAHALITSAGQVTVAARVPLLDAADTLRQRAVITVADPAARAALLREPWQNPNRLAAAKKGYVTDMQAQIDAQPDASPDDARKFKSMVAGFDSQLDERAEVKVQLAEAKKAADAHDSKGAVEAITAVRKMDPSNATAAALATGLGAVLAAEFSTHMQAGQAQKRPRDRRTEFEAAGSAIDLQQKLGIAAAPAAVQVPALLKRAQADVDVEDARAAKAAAAAQKQAAREEARRAAAQREESRGLRCCDGDLSPSCFCHGPHRGCCSHHGGICGCE
jgi:hypothetical protein